MRKVWRHWAKALGQKEGSNDREADAVASIRTVILFTYFVTNCFIVSGVIRHWNDIDNTPQTTLESPVTCLKQ